MAEKLLVIEDSVPILKLINHVGKRAGYDVDSAQSLEETKILLAQNQYAIASIDYNLPDAPQGEAIDYVLSKDIPSIVLTGYMNDEIRDSILSRPVVDYIPKETTQALYYLEKLLKRLRINKQTKVMVVDDSRSARAYLTNLLARHNFQVIEAQNGLEGLEQMNRHTDIKLVITDHEMPEMGGIRFVSEMRKNFNKDKVAVIGLSGANTESLSARFIKSGANDFLKKPFCHEEFYCRIVQNIEHLEQVTRIKLAANTDYLTGLFNRRYFFDHAEQVLKQNPMSPIAMIDIDHFKSINDGYGHDAGDAVIRDIAEQLKTKFSECLLARFGGEEFCILMKDFTSTEAYEALDYFRQDLAERSIKHDDDVIDYTISVGLCNTFDEIHAGITRSDELLYQAKQAGRNQVMSDLEQ
ncbi:diguanylate cyclase [Catenovulum sp. SM1970]|uniref:diguanylate cyclase n=1 Tax=Marinifaba aquimaris TaxID=2741323 RepID=UPI001574A7A5|nr:diguanylate cyclase [Marinifaba aquimaris]NTS76731.1 diguanylate cyclase [Marinifaba aquimaris]